MCFKDETTNELPTTVTADGFEATQIAGEVNPHFNMVKAMTCPIARSYFADAFGGLNAADQDAFIAAGDLTDLTIVGTLIRRDFDGIFGGLLYAALDNALEGADSFDYKARQRARNEVAEADQYSFSRKASDRYNAVRLEAQDA